MAKHTCDTTKPWLYGVEQVTMETTLETKGWNQSDTGIWLSWRVAGKSFTAERAAGENDSCWRQRKGNSSIYGGLATRLQGNLYHLNSLPGEQTIEVLFSFKKCKNSHHPPLGLRYVILLHTCTQDSQTQHQLWGCNSGCPGQQGRIAWMNRTDTLVTTRRHEAGCIAFSHD